MWHSRHSASFIDYRLTVQVHKWHELWLHLAMGIMHFNCAQREKCQELDATSTNNDRWNKSLYFIDVSPSRSKETHVRFVCANGISFIRFCKCIHSVRDIVLHCFRWIILYICLCMDLFVFLFCKNFIVTNIIVTVHIPMRSSVVNNFFFFMLCYVLFLLI